MLLLHSTPRTRAGNFPRLLNLFKRTRLWKAQSIKKIVVGE